MSTLGADSTGTLMGYLPPVGWADVATKHDLDGLRRDLGGLRRDVGGLRRDLDSLRKDLDSLRQEFAAHHHDLDSRFDTLQTVLTATLSAQMDQKLKAQFYWLVTIMVLLFGAFTAVIKLA